jgi:hypothetical protein
MRLHFAVAECYSFSCREDEKSDFAAARRRKAVAPRRRKITLLFRINTLRLLVGRARECHAGVNESLPFGFRRNTWSYYDLRICLLRELQPGECNLPEKC